MKKLFTLFTALLVLGSMTVVQADYYVAGTMNGWNTGHNDYKMNLVSGTVYSKTLTALGANDYEFKITNGSWSQNWGSGDMDNTQSNVTLSNEGSNVKFTLTTASDVTIYFDAGSTKKIYVVALPTSTSYTYTVVGNNATLFGSTWAPATTANDMALRSDGITYVKTYHSVYLTEGDILYKVAADHDWSKTGEYPTSGNYTLNILSDDYFDVTFTYVPSTMSLTAVATPTPLTVKMGGKFLTTEWITTAYFNEDASGNFASITLNDIPEGTHEFKVILYDNVWRSTGGTFTRTNYSAAITGNHDDNMILTADIAGNYTFKWIYESNTLEITYPDLPPQSVDFDGLNASILKGTEVTFAATSTGITNPSYTFYVKEDGGSYGSAVSSYTFDAVGDYVVKVEAEGDNTTDPIIKEKNVSVYETYTFLNGQKLYVDFTAMTEGEKGVNYPSADAANANAYDADGAGTFKTITFTADVTWSTLQDFIKTAKGGWDPGMKFSVPEAGQNCVRVAADGNSYTWDTYVDLTTDFYLAGSFNTWSTTANRFMKASGDATEATVTINITEYSNITFKVIDNGNWRGCNPVKTITKDDNSVTILSDAEGHNVAMTPYAAGDYIFTLDLTTREVTVSYPDGDPMPIPTNIYLSCDVLNSWAAADPAYKFAVSGDIATLDVTLDALTNYAFKLVYNDAWLGANYNFKYYWCTDVPMIADETQANLYSFKEGTYTFTYNLTSGELSIAYPATTATNMTISEYEYATLYSATAFDVPAEVEAYVIPEVDGIKLTMERIYRIPANTGVLLHAAQGTYPFYEGDGRWMDAPASNLLRGTTTDETINNDKVHYVLSYDTEYNVGFYWPYGTGATYGVGAFENKAGKAYLELGGQAASVIARRGFPIRPVQDAATGLDEIESQGEAQKVIHNGQLLIIREGRIYNAQGARVQ